MWDSQHYGCDVMYFSTQNHQPRPHPREARTTAKRRTSHQEGKQLLVNLKRKPVSLVSGEGIYEGILNRKYTHIFMHARTQTCTHAHTPTHKQMNINTHTHTHARMHARTHARTPFRIVSETLTNQL